MMHFLCGMHVFHRVFDGDDMPVGTGVAVVDQGGQRGGFARTCAADEQDQAAFFHDHVFQDLRQTEFVSVGDVGLDIADDHCDLVALLEDIDAETPDAFFADGEVHFGFLFKLLLLFGVHQLVSHCFEHFGGHDDFIDGFELALKFGFGFEISGQIQVGTVVMGEDA